MPNYNNPPMTPGAAAILRQRQIQQQRQMPQTPPVGNMQPGRVGPPRPPMPMPMPMPGMSPEKVRQQKQKNPG